MSIRQKTIAALGYARTDTSPRRSQQHQSRQNTVRHSSKHDTLGGHDGAAVRAAILVLKDAHVLAAARVGAGLRRVDPGLPEGAEREHQHAGVVDRLRERHCARQRGRRREHDPVAARGLEHAQDGAHEDAGFCLGDA